MQIKLKTEIKLMIKAVTLRVSHHLLKQNRKKICLLE